MVLSDPMSSSPEHRPSFYQPGKGNILAHFSRNMNNSTNNNNQESDSSSSSSSTNNGNGGVQLRKRRSENTTSSMFSFPDFSASTNSNNSSSQNNNEIQPTNRQEDGDCMDVFNRQPVSHMSSNYNNNHNNNGSGPEVVLKLTREQELEMWKQQKQQQQQQQQAMSTAPPPPTKAPIVRGKSIGYQIPYNNNNTGSSNSSNSSSCSNATRSGMYGGMMISPIENNQYDVTPTEMASFNPKDKMFAMEFSPPKHFQKKQSTHHMMLPRANSTGSSQRRNFSSSGIISTRHKAHPVYTRQLSKSLTQQEQQGNEYSPLKAKEFVARDSQNAQELRTARSPEEQIEILKKLYDEAFGEVLAATSALEQFRDKNRDLQENHDALVEEIEILRIKIDQKDELIYQLETDFNDPELLMGMEEKKEQQQQEKENPERMILLLRKHIVTLAQQIRQKDDALYLIQQDEGKKTSHINDLQNLNEQLNTLSMEKEIVKEEVLSLRDQLTCMEVRYEKASTSEQALSKEVTNLKADIHLKQEEMDQLIQEKNKLIEEINEKNHFCQQLRMELDLLKRERDQFYQQVALSDTNEINYQKSLNSFKKELENLEGKNLLLDQENQEQKQEIFFLKKKETNFQNIEHKMNLLQTNFQKIQDENLILYRQLDLKNDQLFNLEKSFQNEMNHLEKRLFQNEMIRRNLHNQVMELKGNIRVFVRVRPLLKHEEQESTTTIEQVFGFPDLSKEKRSIELYSSKNTHVSYAQNHGHQHSTQSKKYCFDFDMVMNGNCTQEDIFIEVYGLVQSALDGFNVCIFAYGQTGSGKTFTMQGPEEDNGVLADGTFGAQTGIVGRSLVHIFSTVSDLKDCGWEFTITVEMIEIYNETFRDLLAPSGANEKVELRLDADGNPMVTNSCIHQIHSEVQALRLLEKGMAKRSTKSTNVNNHSSRSHCVTSIRLNGVNVVTEEKRSGVVHLIDLAGSERLSRTGSGEDKSMLKEAQSINKSLSALGHVIGALAQKSRHVPFRDSKLTHFLRPSLMGDSKTLMICNLSPLPQHRDESLNTLRFAKKVNSCEIALSSSVGPRLKRDNTR